MGFEKSTDGGGRRPSLWRRVSVLIARSTGSLRPLFGRDTLSDGGALETAPAEKRGFYGLAAQVGITAIVLWGALSMLFSARSDKGETWRVAHRFTNGSMAFVIMSMSFVGMIMVYQSTVQLDRAVGDITLVGASFIKLLVRVLGPTVIGLLIACRVGAGIAAEIGAMAVTDQLDALRMCAAEPLEVLLVPRLRGGIVAAFALTIIGCFAAVMAGLVTGMVWFGTSSVTYFNFSLVTSVDLIQGLIKAISYGVAVPVVSGTFGLFAYGGAAGVGAATTRAVVGSSFVIVALDSLISLIAHVVSPT